MELILPMSSEEVTPADLGLLPHMTVFLNTASTPVCSQWQPGNTTQRYPNKALWLLLDWSTTREDVVSITAANTRDGTVCGEQATRNMGLHSEPALWYCGSI